MNYFVIVIEGVCERAGNSNHLCSATEISGSKNVLTVQDQTRLLTPEKISFQIIRDNRNIAVRFEL